MQFGFTLSVEVLPKKKKQEQGLRATDWNLNYSL